MGTMSAGQGHETSFAQLLAEWLGVELDQVRLITGDTDVASVGGGSHSGRSMRLGAVVLAKASDAIVDRGKRIAAWLLEAAEADIEFAARRFRVTGTDRSLDLFAVAAAALRDDVPEGLGGPLAGGGEGGTTPALGAVVNAIVDALAELGVEHIEMPATPERVWRAIRAAQAR